jgi:hypothetical protein
MLARAVVEIRNPLEEVADENRLEQLQHAARAGDVLISRSVFPAALVQELKAYLSNVGRSSFPSYHPISANSPNFHRLNDNDERAYVRGCFHQFVFYPWNQDPFQIFVTFRDVFRLKNRIAGLPEMAFLARIPEHSCVARTAFQFYPSGSGELREHMDPLDFHQVVVATLVMSHRGSEYNSGGLFVRGRDGTEIDIEAMVSPGDVMFFCGQVQHGVKRIDPEKRTRWLDFQGRWMGLFAINKVEGNIQISDSAEVSESPVESPKDALPR